MRSIVVILALIAAALLIEFASAGTAWRQADPNDFCFGYAICQ
jgi:hypothetical protein